MLVNLVPDFLAALAAPDPLEAYHRYLADHAPALAAYWHNYVLDLDSPHAADVIRRALAADHRDLHALVERIDLAAVADETTARCVELLEADRPFDVYLMVGVGAANAGELVLGGRGIAFVCLEHFTGRPNPETYGLGLSPDLLPLWIAHEVAHTIRYTSPASRSDLAHAVAEAAGRYDYWETGSRVPLRELLVNEGLAVAAAQAVAPGRNAWDYLGYGRRQYRRLRELDAFLRRAMAPDLDRSGLGYRLRYLAGGASPASRLVGGKIIPERAGYYLGLRMTEAIVAAVGIAAALRASAEECRAAEDRATGVQTA